MLAKFRNHLTYANVMSTLCFFLLLGGTSFAAVTLKKNAVRGKHIAANAVTAPKVRDQSLLAQDFAPGELPQGERGPQGDQGPPGQDATAPANAVMFFNQSSCPAGWSELTGARGRYIVGMPGGGTLGQSVGLALSNGENRPVGQHNHPVNDPGHTHFISDKEAHPDTGSSFATGSDLRIRQQDVVRTPPLATTGITVGNSGAVAGTNAPYLQLLACRKQ